MSSPVCPLCTLADIMSHPEHWECATCGHEWPKEAALEAARIVRDANGNPLADGDSVTVVKDLKVKGSPASIKVGTKVRNIRLIDGVGDHDIDCKVDGFGPMQLKSSVVKKV